MSSATLVARPWSRSTTATLAPSAASTFAVSSPMLRPAPVTIATLSLSLMNNPLRDERPDRSGDEGAHLLVVHALHELVDERAQRDRNLGLLGQIEGDIEVLLGPFAGALAPFGEGP